MSLTSLSRRLNRLECRSPGYLWRIDPKAFPGKSRDEVIQILGRGRKPRPDDIVVMVEGTMTDMAKLFEHSNYVLVNDPEGRTWGEVLLDRIAKSPRSKIGSLIRP